MKNTKKILFSLLLIFILVEVIFIFPQQIEKLDRESIEASGEQKKERVEQKMNGVHLVESQKGARDFELHAEKARGYQQEGDYFLDKVKVQFYNLDANDFTVTGNEGEVDGKTKNIKIKGSVVTRSANGYTFYTDEIFYNFALRKIISPGKIRMVGPSDEQGEGLKLDGYNMHILVDINEMKIFKDITAFKPMSSNQNLKITSEMATFSGKSSEAHFENNVVLNYGSMLIKGPDCYFIYSGKSKKPYHRADLLIQVLIINHLFSISLFFYQYWLKIQRCKKIADRSANYRQYFFFRPRSQTIKISCQSKSRQIPG